MTTTTHTAILSSGVLRRRTFATFALIATCLTAATAPATAQRLALTVYGTGTPDPPRSPNAVWVFNVSTGRTEWKKNGTGTVAAVFTADGRYVVLTRQPSSMGPIQEIYDTATGVTLPMPPGLGDVMAAHPRELALFGTIVAAQGTDVARLDLGGLRVFPACSPGSVVQVDVTTDGAHLVVRCGGFSPNRLIVLDANTGQQLREATVPPGPVSTSASNHDGSRVFIARASSPTATTIELVDMATNQVTTVIDSPFPGGASGGCGVAGVAAARDVAAVTCAWTEVTTGTLVRGTELVRFDTLQRRPLAAVNGRSMHFTPDGATAIVEGGAGLQFVDLVAGAVLAEVTASVGAVGVAFPPMAPAGLSAAACGACVTLSWTLPPQSPMATGYVLEGGTGPGLSNLGTVRLGPTTRLDIPGVAAHDTVPPSCAASACDTSSPIPNVPGQPGAGGQALPATPAPPGQPGPLSSTTIETWSALLCTRTASVAPARPASACSAFTSRFRITCNTRPWLAGHGHSSPLTVTAMRALRSA